MGQGGLRDGSLEGGDLALARGTRDQDVLRALHAQPQHRHLPRLPPGALATVTDLLGAPRTLLTGGVAGEQPGGGGRGSVSDLNELGLCERPEETPAEEAAEGRDVVPRHMVGAHQHWLVDRREVLQPRHLLDAASQLINSHAS